MNTLDKLSKTSDNWEKEGYSIVHDYHPNKAAHNISAYDRDGNKVGGMWFYEHEDGHLKVSPGSLVWVDQNHRRKGIASAMYKEGEARTGKKFKQGYTTPEGSKLWNSPDRSFGKSLLQKSAARRLFGKVKKLSSSEKKSFADWQTSQGEDTRAFVPRLQDPGERLRAFNKIARKTMVRKDPNTGEKIFLLHRGMSDNEYQKTNKNDSISHSAHSSWTPDYKIAKEFGRMYDGGVVSAWIKESDIHAVPYAKTGEFPEESEVIVKPYHKSTKQPYQEKESVVDKLKIHKVLNSLKKSMTLQEKVYGKDFLSKSDDNKKFSRGLTSADTFPGWEDNNPDLHHGVDTTQNHYVQKEHTITKGSHLSPGPNGYVFLKPHLTEKDLNITDSNSSNHSFFNDSNFTSSHREAMFHELAKNHFALGQYVPKTSLVKHPDTMEPWSAQHFINNANPVIPGKTNLNNSVFHPDDLHKMGIMDMVLGNNDRHLKNIILDPDKRMHLIDNAMSFDFSHKIISYEVPATIVQSLRNDVSDSVHKWIHNLDTKSIKDALRAKGAPEPITEMVERRLKEAKRWSTLIQGNPHFANDLGGLHELVSSHRLNWGKDISSAVREVAMHRIKRGDVFGGRTTNPESDTFGLDSDKTKGEKK